MKHEKSRIIKGFVLLSRVDADDDCVQRITQLLGKMTLLEGDIAEEFDILKEKYNVNNFNDHYFFRLKNN